MSTPFVNRVTELNTLNRWWDSGRGLALVWGRRRVGKTLLLEQFARDKSTIFHTFDGRPVGDALRLISHGAAETISKSNARDFRQRPFSDWDDLIDELCRASHDRPLLLILDEFPEALSGTPQLPNLLRAAERKILASRLRILLCGSATRTMEAIQEQRAPLYGRFDTALLLHPFEPHEAALMLRRLSPSDRALVWGLLGGVPLYLSWWDQDRTIRQNLRELACTPGQRLFAEGELVMQGEAFGDLERQVLFAIAAGRTTWGEIRDAIGTIPTRVLDNLVRLRVVDRIAPVTESGRDARKVRYQIIDNFIAFWLGPLARYRTQIHRGLGATVVSALLTSLDDFMGPRWVEAVRRYLVQRAVTGDFGEDVTGVGPFWTSRGPAGADPNEIDAVVTTGRDNTAVAVCEAKWARSVNGETLHRELERKSLALPHRAKNITYIIAAREEVRANGVMPVVAADIFP